MKKLFIIAAFFLVACVQSTQMQLISPNGENINLIVEIAESSEERSQGLMFRKELPRNHGMLFAYQNEQSLSFWMKNTLIPLDILFFDADGVFVSATTMQPCIIEQCPSYQSEAPSKYALEVAAGFVKRLGVEEGWRVVL